MFMDNEPGLPTIPPKERILCLTQAISENIKDKPIRLIDVLTTDEGGDAQVSLTEVSSVIQGVMEIKDRNVFQFDLGSAEQLEEAEKALQNRADKRLLVFSYPPNIDRLLTSVGLGYRILSFFTEVQDIAFANEKNPRQDVLVQSYQDSLYRALVKRESHDALAKIGYIPRIELNPEMN